ncbi:MAG: coenzyme F420-0:L-glutamate ligase [SAR202 cluster bacterium]|jgi:coenzyme F420-0:L-glutamate ligase/coenzyme F420-1:gamma-L-glutamate ligase|nr:coenzyme F420-0:L-glutamate ligase [Chloroflexota bacterium]MDP6422457.1 coenzyme F420-0:L-glutamate ligase [SAR202 cluster bacterium]HAL47670.1 coenzyme F420-0:L-glutamate ligase [Dehalococcoidia bacterium]MDP6663555.1 coenzyme F420-0:L-glutamate ligase [SAR202 cluster bacterium]MDP6800723.1 coenzyme F420-0:L-glutamate ligase [SAR202 cluster bacterium]|tara:strand:- start:739 stop:1521 length:783 start_codon:yes stop_codon:yes gene_type:complete
MTDSAAPHYPSVQAIGIVGLPEIEPGANLGRLIADAAARQGTPLMHGDILVVTQKIVSKAEDRVVALNSVEPSEFAAAYAAEAGRDPRLVELVLRESAAVVRMDAERGVLITETHHGFVCANAGIDMSNVPDEDSACLLPVDPDESARRIRADIEARSGVAPPIIISDTFGRAWRDGHVNFAIGIAGMDPMVDYRGTEDAHGRTMHVTTIAVADELAATAELVTAKAINVPVALIRGLPYRAAASSTAPLLRERSRDMFR